MIDDDDGESREKKGEKKNRAGCRIFFSFGKMASSFFFNLIFFSFLFLFKNYTINTKESPHHQQTERFPPPHSSINQPTPYITGLILILLTTTTITRRVAQACCSS